MTTTSKRSFAGGEVSPSLYPKVDQLKFQTGLRTCKNAIVQKYGGVQNRSGTEFVGYTNFGVRMIPYVVSPTAAYMLEFSLDGVRVIADGSYIEDAAIAISSTTMTGSVITITTSSPHGISDNEQVRVTGTGVPKLDGRICRADYISATVIKLLLSDGTYLDGDAFTGTPSGGDLYKPYIFDANLDDIAIDRADIKFSQTGNVLTVVHPEVGPQEIVRVDDTDWTVREALSESEVDPPVTVSITPASGSANTESYMVTAIDSEGRESVPGFTSTAINTITAITQANPCVLTVGTNWTTLIYPGDIVRLASIGGMTELNNKYITVEATSSTTITLNIDSTDFEAYTSSGFAWRVQIAATGATPSVTAPWTISWGSYASAVEFKIYKKSGGHDSPNPYGLIGTSTINSFQDQGFSPDLSDSNPIPAYYFNVDGDYPAIVGNYEQRQIFSASENAPQRVLFSRTGDGLDFAKRSNFAADNPFNLLIRGDAGDYITNIVDIGKLLVFTASSVRIVSGDESGISPLTVQTKRNSGEGSAKLTPQVISNSVFFLESRGTDIKKLDYSLESVSYEPTDTTDFSNHLFEGYTIVAWAYQQNPHSILWVVRSDGKLLGLTYVKSQKIMAWHQHDVGGFVSDVEVVSEGSTDTVYLHVGRNNINYIERFTARNDTTATSFKYMDSLGSFNGESQELLGNMTLTGGTAWDETDLSLTLTASSYLFYSSDVGNDIRFRDELGEEVIFSIVGFTSGTTVTGTVNTSVPATLQATATSDWAKAVDTVAGLDHLEGEPVSIMADGFVIASPNNTNLVSYTVTNGEVTLPNNYVNIYVGLPFVTDVETLDIDSSQAETVADKKMLVTEVTPHLYNTRGVFVGPRALDATSIVGLVEMKLRSIDNYSDVPNLTSGASRLTIRADWKSNGRVLFRQVDPVPMTISAVHLSGLMPFRSK